MRASSLLVLLALLAVVAIATPISYVKALDAESSPLFMEVDSEVDFGVDLDADAEVDVDAETEVDADAEVEAEPINSPSAPLTGDEVARRASINKDITQVTEYLRDTQTPLDAVMKRVEQNLDAVRLEEHEEAIEAERVLFDCAPDNSGNECRNLTRQYRDCEPGQTGLACRENLRKALAENKNLQLRQCGGNPNSQEFVDCRNYVYYYNLCANNLQGYFSADSCRAGWMSKIKADYEAKIKCPWGFRGTACRRVYIDMATNCGVYDEQCRRNYTKQIDQLILNEKILNGTIAANATLANSTYGNSTNSTNQRFFVESEVEAEEEAEAEEEQ